jgi:outer membrane lipoprotein-sorting protein
MPMKIRSQLTVSLSAVLFGAALLLSVIDSAAQEQTGEAILHEVERRFAQVQDFSVTLDVVADIERLNVPPMHAQMYFKQPDKMHFETEGTAILPREGLMLSITRLTAKYTVEKTGREEIGGRSCFTISLRPRDVKAASRGITVLIDSVRMTPERITSSLPDGRAAIVSFEHTSVDGHWMPSMLMVTFTVQSADSTEASPWDQESPLPRRQPPRKGTVTIRYSNYKINTGLDDALFEKGVDVKKQ